jgi:predicted nucleotidyltransferase
MDLTRPIQSVVPSLDGAVLDVLVRTTRPLTGREVHRLAGTGSESGVRIVLNRLAAHGLVDAEARAQAVFYTFNRRHLAADAIVALARLRPALYEKLRQAFRPWDPKPLHASVFGSAARGDGTADSDVDLLLVRPAMTPSHARRWAGQTDLLAANVRAWTGNPCQLYELTRPELARHIRAREPVVESWHRDGIVVFGDSLDVLLRDRA